MAHISGVFASPDAGLLTLVLSGNFFSNQADRTASLPPNGGNCLIGARINNIPVQGIDRYTPTTTTEFDYPGGNVQWLVSTYTVAVSNPSSGGPQSWGMKALKIDLRLAKR